MDERLSLDCFVVVMNEKRSANASVLDNVTPETGVVSYSLVKDIALCCSQCSLCYVESWLFNPFI